MTPNLAQHALNFLGRVTLTGAEAGTFFAVVKALEDIAQPATNPELESDQPDDPRT